MAIVVYGVVGAVVVGVIGGSSYSDYSDYYGDYSNYSNYSDYAERQRRIKEQKIREFEKSKVQLQKFVDETIESRKQEYRIKGSIPKWDKDLAKYVSFKDDFFKQENALKYHIGKQSEEKKSILKDDKEELKGIDDLLKRIDSLIESK